ncbi:short-chain alcohol-related dehydrogenase [Gaiella occulta]|uniref:Short-chain alcohol-related dehydrogenase n=1 Tax=Gaiella occulta TaxID=1002870 RepID=A0A7M2Z165_9ACTN|nr:SDR family oxidoreductase [Gaiella occulta]RDI75541.1 short-chain alcohol-related dehydrogenase [Gaiella occulta]
MSGRELAGQVAIVTGAARAIGRTTAETLAARGATVVSIDLLPADDTVAAIEAGGGTALALAADVTDEAAVEDAVARVTGTYGRVDVLVNNAGLFAGIERRPFWEIPLDEWEHVLTVNVRSVFLCSRAVAAPMREAGVGRIVNIASNVITFGMANLMHYVASKSAVVGITRSMARELGPSGIAVNAVAPGLVTTEITAQTVPEEYRRLVAEGQCLQQAILPSDIAEAVAYLAGPAARMITGQTVLVNGGATMGPA